MTSSNDTTATTVIPGDWDVTDPNTWTLETTVDAHMGYHHTGMVMREYQTITLAASNYAHGDDLGIGQDSAEWWLDVLDGIMAGKVAEAEASPEVIAAAWTALVGPDTSGPDEWAERGEQFWQGYGDDVEMEAIGGRKLAAAIETARTSLSA